MCTQAQFGKEEADKLTGYDGVMMRLGMHSYCIRKYLKRNKIKFHDFNFLSTIYCASGYFHGRRLLLFGGGVRRSTEHFPRSTVPRPTLHVHDLPGPDSPTNTHKWLNIVAHFRIVVMLSFKQSCSSR